MILLVITKLLAIVNVTYGVRSFSIEIVSFEQKFSPQYYSTLTVQMIKVADRMVLNGSVVFIRDMGEINIRVTANVVQDQSGKESQLFSVSEDVCKLIDRSRKMPVNLIYYVRESFASAGHLVADHCPYKKGEDYYLKNFYLDAEKFPLNIPHMRLKIILRLQQRKFVFYECNVTIAVEGKQSKRKTPLKNI